MSEIAELKEIVNKLKKDVEANQKAILQILDILESNAKESEESKE